MSVLTRFWNQSFRLPKPTFTDRDLSDQSGRVFLITGGYAGLGFELARFLFQKNGIVYLAGRTASKGEAALSRLRAEYPESSGRAAFLLLDLSDLSTIKASAEDFMRQEHALHVLVNNAGVYFPPLGSTSAQGHEMTIATNCLGPFLFTLQLLPILRRTAISSPAGTVRVTWATSIAIDLVAPLGGMELDGQGAFAANSKDQEANYAMSKAGNFFLSTEFARRYPLESDGNGIISNSFHPGNLRSELQRNMHWLKYFIVNNALLYEPVYGAYTELYAGWSNDAGKAENNGKYIIPWGRIDEARADVEAEAHKENGKAHKFWEWCEKETKAYS